jgi:hypothetical protein
VTLREADVVLNVVWTGTVFTYLRLFVASQIDRSEARFRFIANGCPPEQVALMERFAAACPDRVVEVVDVSPDAMIAHGVALDRVRAVRDDGELWCLIDPDIKAGAPFVGEFLALLDDHDAVTSGTEVWSDDNVVPVDHPGVAGEFFYDRDGFVFGSPHLALYRRDALDETCARWGVGLGSAGPELRDDTKARLAEMGHGHYIVFDTAKIVNTLLQGDGHPLVHRDLPQLVHIGGLAHYLSPPAYRTTESGEVEPDWTRFEIMTARHEVTRHTARTLRHLLDGEPEPPLPEGLDEGMEAKLRLVHQEVVDLVERYGRT